MRRPAEILTTLIVFAIVMAGIGWGLNATVPSVHEWLIASIGRIGAWALLVAILLTCAVIAWRGHRPTKGSAGNVRGR